MVAHAGHSLTDVERRLSGVVIDFTFTSPIWSRIYLIDCRSYLLGYQLPKFSKVESFDSNHIVSL